MTTSIPMTTAIPMVEGPKPWSASADITLASDTEPTDDGDTDNNTNLSLDLGFIEPAQLVDLGDTVWFDTNNNGIIDGGETGITGVTVELFRAGEDPTTATPTRSEPCTMP